METFATGVLSLAAILCATAPASRALADVKLSALFSDHTVLQRDVAVPVWGWADAGERVTVEIAGQRKTTTADEKGNWSVRLDPLHVGDPLTLAVKGNNAIAVNDVLVGEVWLASGQSNMSYAMEWHPEDYAADVAASADPQLRMFTVPPHGSLDPEQAVNGKWEPAEPKTTPHFSAVGYHFARYLRQALGVPVGIIHSSFGGTPAEAWTSEAALDRDPTFHAIADEQRSALRRAPDEQKAFDPALAAWIERNQAQAPDAGDADAPRAKPEFDDAGWKTARVPAKLRKLGLDGGGVVWYRKTVTLPDAAAAKDFDLGTEWGGTEGLLTVYFNGTPLQDLAPSHRFARAAHRFRVPRALVRPGRPNVIAVRQYALSPEQRLEMRASKMGLPVADPNSVDDDWRFDVETRFPALSADAIKAIPSYPDPQPQYTATCLFNAMIHPLVPYAIKGAIWYQGESNAGRASQYRQLLTTMIDDWRGRWGEGNFPFYLVQLANFNAPTHRPVESGVAALREAQLQVSQSVPDTGLAVAIDVGEEDIHPRNKREVGRRLSLIALDHLYGQKQPFSGPIYDGMTVEGNRVRLRFTHADGGLVGKGGDLRQFTVAGADGKFFAADAKVDGDTVVVSSDQVKQPTAVRYAWADNPEGCNLYNGAGLPASPFRTDSK